MRLCSVICALMLPLSLEQARAYSGDERPNVKTIRCGPVYTKPGFTSVEAFVESLDTRTAPWGDLLMPDDFPDYENPEDFRHTLSESKWSGGVTVVHRSRDYAIVFALHKITRTSPFCAVVFLLQRTGRRYHVVDFIRRSEGYESYSTIGKPEMLKLQPDIYPHFYFAEYLGGRRYNFDTHQFYIVRNHRFQRTLLLKNDGAFLSPAEPYREFDQQATIHAGRGRLLVTVRRSWTIDDKPDQEKTFTTVFRWNARQRQFASNQIGKIVLKQPESWSGDGLPHPAAGKR